MSTAAAVDATRCTVPRLRVWQRPAPLVAGIVALLGRDGPRRLDAHASRAAAGDAPDGDPVRRNRPRPRSQRGDFA